MNIINEFFVSFILIKLYFKFKVCRKIKFPLLWKFYFSKWKFYFSADTNVKPKITQLTQGKDNHPVLKEIQKAIQQAQFYPRQAKKMRMQGTVKVEFLWKENKTLADLKIIESSGYDLLDKSALESIRKASLNFPHYNGDLRITLPIIYDFKTLRG